MRATHFEFRYRFWVIAVIFFLSFSLYGVDHQSSSDALCRLIHHGQSTDAQMRWFFLGGMLIIFLGGVVRTWASAYLHSAVVHDADLHSDRLVADGPFRHLRNPLYLGTVLLAIGMATMASRWGAAVLIALMILFTLRLIGREEAELKRSQPASYAAFCAAVPRLWPSFRARVPSSGAQPRWGQAWMGELPFWGFGLALGVFSLHQNFMAFSIVLYSSLGLYLVNQQIFKFISHRRGAASPASR